jgi:hypothetical protein
VEKVVDLTGLEIQLVQCGGDLVGREVSRFPPGVQQRLGVVRLQQVDDDLRCGDFLGCAHSVPPSWTGVVAMPHCASWFGRAP